MFRLKDGQTFSDWQVTEIGPRSITIKKEDQTFRLNLFGPRPHAMKQAVENDEQDSENDQVSYNQAGDEPSPSGPPDTGSDQQNNRQLDDRRLHGPLNLIGQPQHPAQHEPEK